MCKKIQGCEAGVVGQWVCDGCTSGVAVWQDWVLVEVGWKGW